MYRKHAPLVALVAATWLAIAGVGLLVWGMLLAERPPGLLVSGVTSLGAAALTTMLAVRFRPR